MPKKEVIDVRAALSKAKDFLQDDRRSVVAIAEVREIFTPLLSALEALVEKLGKNSKNSSISPSQDQNRAKDLKSGKEDSKKKKPGGQLGRVGKHLAQFEKADEIIEVPIDRSTLPAGHVYKAAGHEARQVVEITIKRCVKEYRLEIVQDETGKCYKASAPAGVKGTIQYGASVKAQSAYLYAFQMIPYARIEDYFRDQAGIPISVGTIFNMHKEGYRLLENFEAIVKANLCGFCVEHSDETGINIGGKRHWIHDVSNDKWTLYFPHQKRGTEAMNEMGILPNFIGVLVHDHWLPYYTYKQCTHSLCNAHHLRELEWVKEKFPTHTWAASMQNFLRELNVTVDKAGGFLTEKEQREQTASYLAILTIADGESPPPPIPIPKEGEKKRRGKIKRTKERNLIERLGRFAGDVLRFMTQKDVPFTNNQAERDLRMVKVQQKVSGCFRSENGAKIFCRIRSYILTCQKHGLAAAAALAMLYNGTLPDFCKPSLIS